MPNKGNKTVVVLISGLLILLVASSLAYTLYGHQVIKQMYESRSIAILNRVIVGQDTHTLEFYFNKADRLFYKILLTICCSLLFYMFLIKLYIYPAPDLSS